MKNFLYAAIATFCLFIIGCGDNTPYEDKHKTMSEDNVMKSYKDAHDKAGTVEDMILDADKKRRDDLKNME